MDSLFKYRKLNTGGVAKAEFVTSSFEDLLSNISVHCNVASREFAIAKTKLEEACMFAKKSIALDPANQADPK